MKRVEIEMFSETTNCPVVRVPHRHFPGVVVQGDSLMNLLSVVKELCRLTSSTKSAELTDAAAELMDTLWDYVSEYEKTMQSHGLELPYPKPMTR
jgi:hypothetical protein